MVSSNRTVKIRSISPVSTVLYSSDRRARVNQPTIMRPDRSISTESSRRRYREAEGIVWFPFAALFLGAIVGLYGIIYAIDHILPTPLTIKDEADNPDAFIAERAREHLRELVAIGPKVAGHEANEVRAVNLLTTKINEIIAGSHQNQKIELDVQVVTGSYYLAYKPYGTVQSYANIQNVVVKIYSEKESNHSVLINSHFDTVPNSPGGSDDGIMVAVGLEIIRVLSKSPTRPKNNLVFLFNGAEEAGLLGSHGFISDHKWAPEARVLVNLEATGGGGKEILFQTGPDEPWLFKYYDVPHPHGNAAGEEIFQGNIIPSDTDFRIFRDYGGLIGYDFAYTRDGYRYHTKYDGFENVEYGRYQHTGDNILKLVRNLADASEVENPVTGDGKVIFFDFLGLFLVHYSTTTGIIINSVVIAVSILLMIWSFMKIDLGNLTQSMLYTTMIAFIILLGWAISAAVVVSIASILDASNRSMGWYSQPWLNFGLYIAPVCFVLLTTRAVVNRVVRNKRISLSQKAIIQVHINRFMWTLVLLGGTIMGLRMVYVIMVGVLFNNVTMLIVQCLDLYKKNLSEKIWPYLYIVSTILPTMMMLSYGHEVVALFIPILGRFGSTTNPDMMIGLMLAFFTILIVSYYIPLFVYIKNPWYTIGLLGAIFIAAIILVYTHIGFPYTFDEEHPRLQRYNIYHTHRKVVDDNNELLWEDAGFYFTKLDRNTPRSIEGQVSFLANITSLDRDCDLILACGLPITNSRSLKNLDNSVWIPADKPTLPSSITYSITRIDLGNQIQYNFEIEGSDRIDVYLSIRKQVKLININLVEEVPKDYVDWKGQRTYYLSFVYGKTPAPFKFSFTVEIPDKMEYIPTADVAIAAKFVHDDINQKTEEYQQFLDEFPEWTVFTVSALAYYENIVLHSMDN